MICYQVTASMSSHLKKDQGLWPGHNKYVFCPEYLDYDLLPGHCNKYNLNS